MFDALDYQKLMLAASLMGLVITSRPFVKALSEWLGAFYNALKWIRRRTLDELYRRVRSLEERLDEHESDVEAHTREPVDLFDPRE